MLLFFVGIETFIISVSFNYISITVKKINWNDLKPYYYLKSSESQSLPGGKHQWKKKISLHMCSKYSQRKANDLLIDMQE